jgi:hypothetical protein
VWKVSELDEYDEALEKREKDKALVDSGKMTKEEFIANALIEPGCPPCSSSFVVNNEMRNGEGFCPPQLMKHCWPLAMQGLEPPSELDSFLNYKMDQLQRYKGAIGVNGNPK